MNKNDLQFFEEYKKLDLQLKDLLGADTGVSAYLAAMEETASADRASVPGWNADYRLLKHLRWARNQLAHQSEDSDSVTIREDLLDLQDFSRRVLDGTDPLALLRAAREKSSAKRRTVVRKRIARKTPETSKSEQIDVLPFKRNADRSVADDRSDRASEEKRSSLLWLILLLLLVAALTGLIIYALVS